MSERPSEEEAIERVYALMDPGTTLHSLTYVGEAEYQYIYLAIMEGEYEGNTQMRIRYAYLSKPDAYDNDTFATNGMNLRWSDGLAGTLPSAIAAASNRMGSESESDDPPLYQEGI